MVALIVSISFIISVSLLILIILFQDSILRLFNLQDIGSYLLFLPLMTFVFGVYQAVYFTNLRQKHYKVIRNVTVYRSSVNAFMQVLLGLLSFSTLGLIISQLLATLSGFYYSIKHAVLYRGYIKDIRLKRMKILMFRFKDFPKYSLPSSFLNIFSYEIVNTMIAIP